MMMMGLCGVWCGIHVDFPSYQFSGWGGGVLHLSRGMDGIDGYCAGGCLAGGA